MKILVLSHTSELVGGAERSLLDVFDIWIRDYGVELEFIIRQPVKSLSKALNQRGWEYHAFDYGFWSDGNPPVSPEDIFRNATRNSQAVQEIEKVIDDTKPDFVLTNSVVCPWAAIAAHFQGVPHIWFVREYGDLDHGRKYEIGRKKTLTDVGNLSNLVVANSKTLEKHLAKYIESEKLTTLYTPFDLDKINERAAKKVKSPYKSTGSLKLITTNNIAPTKGQLEAVEAVGKLNEEGFDVEICVMGAGDKQNINAIKEMIHRYGVDEKVHLVGLQPDTLPYIALTDVGIMASRKEAFGRATFECLAASKPVVGADSGATPEMVEAGVNGYLYSQGSSDSLAAELKHYLEDRILLESHGQAARQTAKDMMNGEYNIGALYGRVEQAVKSGVDDKQSAPINYLHRWLEYVLIGQRAMNEAHTFTFRRIVTLRLKRRLRKPYLRLKTLVAWVTGK